MTVWVQNLKPLKFCLQAKRNNLLILRHVIELCIRYGWAKLVALIKMD